MCRCKLRDPRLPERVTLVTVQPLCGQTCCFLSHRGKNTIKKMSIYLEGTTRAPKFASLPLAMALKRSGPSGHPFKIMSRRDPVEAWVRHLHSGVSSVKTRGAATSVLRAGHRGRSPAECDGLLHGIPPAHHTEEEPALFRFWVHTLPTSRATWLSAAAHVF